MRVLLELCFYHVSFTWLRILCSLEHCFFFISSLFPFVTFYFFIWSIVDLQSSANYCCQAKLFSYTYIHFYILFHYGLSQDIEYSSLCYTVRSCYLSNSIRNSLHLLSPSSPLPYPSPFLWQTQVCSLGLWVTLLLFLTHTITMDLKFFNRLPHIIKLK